MHSKLLFDTINEKLVPEEVADNKPTEVVKGKDKERTKAKRKARQPELDSSSKVSLLHFHQLVNIYLQWHSDQRMSHTIFYWSTREIRAKFSGVLVVPTIIATFQ